LPKQINFNWYKMEKLKIGIITVSDRTSQGIYEDLSGQENKISIRKHCQGDKRTVLVSEFMENFRKELKIV
jgi:molybdopterin biosynthesis enzyme MoaB